MEARKLKASIVMSTYNSMKYLIYQLDSIKNQDYKDFEVIITDDCSKDETLDFIKNYISNNKLENWKLFENENNVGYAKNFKRGIEKATGEIIFLCDHDDIWFSNKLSDLVKIFDENSKIGLLGTSFEFIDGNGNQKEEKKSLLSIFTSNHNLIKYHIGSNKIKRLSFKKVFTYSYTPGCCMAFRNEYKNDVINVINVAPHDYSISAYFSNIKAAYFYNRPYIYYRVHENNQIGIKDKNDLEERIIITKKDYDDKQDILNNLENKLKSSNLSYAKKHLKFIKKRKKVLEKKNKGKLILMFIRSLFMKRYFYTILKDLTVL